MTDQEKKVKKEAPKKEHPAVVYLRETRLELKKVRWPDRQETWNLTRIVLAFTFGMALFLGVLDLIFVRMLRGIVAQDLWAYAITAVVLGAIVAATVLIKRSAEA